MIKRKNLYVLYYAYIIATLILVAIFVQMGYTYSMVFVLGLGRSGTNMLAEVLISHPALIGDIEGPTFSLAVKAALGLSGAVQRYINSLSPMDMYVKKDHPVMWFWGAMPADNKGIYIDRGFMDHAASCLHHDGVQSWLHNSSQYPPNGLSGSLLRSKLGLSSTDYATLSIYGKLAIRYLTAKYVARTLNDVVYVTYEGLVQHPTYWLGVIGDYINVNPARFDTSIIKSTSIDKYKQTLSTYEITTLRSSYNNWFKVFKTKGLFPPEEF